MRWKFVSSVVAAALLGTSIAYAAGFTLSAAPKIAFLYFADKHDGGWTQAFDEARPKIEAAVGQKIPYVENVPEVAGKIKPAAETFISRGYNVIIGTAFGYSDTFKELAEKYPKVAFLNASGTTNGPNLNPFMDALTKASIFAAWWPVQCPRPANSASLQRIRSVR